MVEDPCRPCSSATPISTSPSSTDVIPTGDEKAVARDYAVSFGGNAVTAAFASAKLGIAPDLMSTVSTDWLGRMFIDMALSYGPPCTGAR